VTTEPNPDPIQPDEPDIEPVPDDNPSPEPPDTTPESAPNPQV
jgi:hypothetical protein